MILQNKIKILFIQDEETSNSACAISVGVGSLLDKDRSLGLAHFL
jgi:secreted Zn-dependent insulinase-like peptidase